MIANNELWVKSTDGSIVTMYRTTGFSNTIQSSLLNDDGWTVFTFYYDLTTIGDYAFSGKTGIAEVIMPETVTNIKMNAFRGCSRLTSITLPSGLTTIGENAFYSCSGLTSIEMPDSVTSLGNGAFYYCSSIEEARLSDGLTSIGQNAFRSCSRLTTVKWPKNLQSIGTYAFTACPLLKTAYLPDTVTSIGNYAFSQCASLQSVNFGPTTNIGSYSFQYCDALQELYIPSGATVGTNVFEGCDGLVKIVIEEGHPVYDSREDCNCMVKTSTNSIVLGSSSATIPETVTSIGRNAFSGRTGAVMIIPDNITTIEESAFYEAQYEHIEIGNGVTSIPTYCFYRNTALKSIVIGTGVTSIAAYAFSGCQALLSITCYATTAPSIERYTFSDVKKNGTLYYPARSDYGSWLGIASNYLGYYKWTGEEIGAGEADMPEDYAPDDYVPVSIPNNEIWCKYTGLPLTLYDGSFGPSLVQTRKYGPWFIHEFDDDLYNIPQGAFFSARTLTTVILPDSVTEIGYQAFRKSAYLTDIRLPENLQSIGECAFESCYRLASLNLPESLSEIGRYAFDQCRLIAGHLIIPDNVSTIEAYAFRGCSSITQLTLGDRLFTIGDYAFNNCSGLTGDLIVPNNVESIGYRAFEGADLTSITLGSSLQRMEEWTFAQQPISSITCYATTAPAIERTTFYGIASGGTMEYPEGSDYRAWFSNDEYYLGYHGWEDPHPYNPVPDVPDEPEEPIVIVIPDSIPDNELWARNIRNTEASLYDLTEFYQNLVETEFTDDKWTIFRFDAPLTKVGAYAFYGSSMGITHVVVPETVTEFGDAAFIYQYTLEYVNFPEALTKIGAYALSLSTAYGENSAITSIHLGPNITHVGHRAFEGLKGLTAITCDAMIAPEVNESFDVATGGTLYHPQYTDYSTWMSNDPMYLGYFGWSEGISKETEFGPNQILKVMVDNNTIPVPMLTYLSGNTLAHSALVDDGIVEYYFLNDLTSIPKGFFYQKTNVIDFELPQTCTVIETQAFHNTGLVNVVLPDWVTEIGPTSFATCNSLVSFKVGSGLKVLEYNSLAECPALKTVDLGQIESIGNYAFDSSGIEELVIPATLTSIGSYVFNGSKLRLITSNAVKAPVISPNTFYGVPRNGLLYYPKTSDYSAWLSKTATYLGYYGWKGNLVYDDNFEYEDDSKTVITKYIGTGTTVTIPSQVTAIADEAFLYAQLTSINIPDNVTYIGAEAFYGSSISSLYIGAGVEEIGIRAFSLCRNLTTIQVSPQNQYFDSRNNCNAIINKEGTFLNNLYIGCKGTVIPDSVVGIRANAFYDCVELTSIEIPDSVMTIWANAFAGCYKLERVDIGNGLLDMDSGVFFGCSKLKYISCKAATAPYVSNITFEGIATGGTLVCNGDHTYDIRWMRDEPSYLGYYGWNKELFEIYITSDLDGSFEEETLYRFTITHAAGATITLDAPDEFIFDLLGTEYNGDGSATSTYTLYIYDTYAESTAIISISDGRTAIQKIITVYNNEEEMPSPSISISYSAGNLNFAQDGGTVNLTITYNNAVKSRVNKPLVTATGVEIVETGYTDGETSYKSWCTVTVEKTTYSRTIPLVFSCIGLDGSSCSEILTLTQEGAENKIKLSSYSGTYPAEGEYRNNAFRIYLTDFDGDSSKITWAHYTYTDTGVQIAAGWFKAYTGDGYDYFDVDVNKWEGTEPHYGVVRVSFTDFLGQKHSADYTVIQNGADDTPADVLEPEVQPYVTIVRVTEDGNNAQQTGYKKIRVNYQDLSGGTINQPRVTADWFRIVGSSIVRNDEDGVLYEYTWEADANSGDARSTTVIFNADFNYTTYTGTVEIQQARHEADTPDDPDKPVEPRPDDPDNPDIDNPDIPIIDGVYIGPIWKDVEFDFGNMETVNYSIYFGTNLIFSGKSWKRPNANRNTVKVNKICQNYLSQGYLDLDKVGWQINNDDFTLRSQDGSIVYATYRFVNDWSYSDYFKAGWLYHPILENQIGVRGQMFPFSILGAGSQVSLEYGVEYRDDYTDSYGNPVEDWWSTEYITKGVLTDFFRVARRDADYIDTVWIDNQRYRLKERCEIPYVVYYLNPWGGYDWFPIRGRVNVIDKMTPYTYNKNFNNTTIEFGQSRYLSEISREYELNTGWLKQIESDRMWYLLQSNVVYLHDINADKIYPVIIKDTRVERQQKTKTEKILNYTFTVEFSQTRQRI